LKAVVDEQMITSTRAVILCGSGDNLRILLVRRKFPPYDGSLTLPGGFLKSGETSFDTIKRKTLKETGFIIDENCSSYNLTPRYHNQDPRGFQLTDNYLFIVPEKLVAAYEHESSDGAHLAEWYYLDEVERLGFNHGAILCEVLGGIWKRLPSYINIREQIELPTAYSFKDTGWNEPVTFFSGSFDPWHNGHQACLDLCPNKNIVIVPDSNPWKIISDRNQKRCCWQEYRELALRFEQTCFAVFPGYYGMEDGNPTVDWLPKVRGKNKEFLMGLDSFLSFPKWKSVRYLLQSISKIYVVPRETNHLVKTEEIVRNLKQQREEVEIIFLQEHSYMNLSSTEIRKR